MGWAAGNRHCPEAPQEKAKKGSGWWQMLAIIRTVSGLAVSAGVADTSSAGAGQACNAAEPAAKAFNTSGRGQAVAGRDHPRAQAGVEVMVLSPAPPVGPGPWARAGPVAVERTILGVGGSRDARNQGNAAPSDDAAWETRLTESIAPGGST